jgi:hypothetical protein
MILETLFWDCCKADHWASIGFCKADILVSGTDQSIVNQVRNEIWCAVTTITGAKQVRNRRETGAKQARNSFFYENAPVRSSIAPVSRLFRACFAPVCTWSIRAAASTYCNSTSVSLTARVRGEPTKEVLNWFLWPLSAVQRREIGFCISKATEIV